MVPVNLFEVDVVVPGQREEERQQLAVDVEEVAEAGRGVTLTGDVTLARILIHCVPLEVFEEQNPLWKVVDVEVSVSGQHHSLARAAVPLSTTTAISWRGLKDLSQ